MASCAGEKQNDPAPRKPNTKDVKCLKQLGQDSGIAIIAAGTKAMHSAWLIRRVEAEAWTAQPTVVCSKWSWGLGGRVGRGGGGKPKSPSGRIGLPLPPSNQKDNEDFFWGGGGVS